VGKNEWNMARQTNKTSYEKVERKKTQNVLEAVSFADEKTKWRSTKHHVRVFEYVI